MIIGSSSDHHPIIIGTVWFGTGAQVEGDSVPEPHTARCKSVAKRPGGSRLTSRPYWRARVSPVSENAGRLRGSGADAGATRCAGQELTGVGGKGLAEGEGYWKHYNN